MHCNTGSCLFSPLDVYNNTVSIPDSFLSFMSFTCLYIYCSVSSPCGCLCQPFATFVCVFTSVCMCVLLFTVDWCWLCKWMQMRTGAECKNKDSGSASWCHHFLFRTWNTHSFSTITCSIWHFHSNLAIRKFRLSFLVQEEYKKNSLFWSWIQQNP